MLDLMKIGLGGAHLAGGLMEIYRDSFGECPATVIAAAAALAGEQALRATRDEMPKTGWVFDDATADLVYKRDAQGKSSLWGFVRSAAVEAGADVRNLLDPAYMSSHITAQFGVRPFPNFDMPEADQPRERPESAVPRLRTLLRRPAEDYDLSPIEAAMAAAWSTGILLRQNREGIPPETAARLAFQVMIVTSHIAPVDQAAAPANPAERLPAVVPADLALRKRATFGRRGIAR